MVRLLWFSGKAAHSEQHWQQDGTLSTGREKQTAGGKKPELVNPGGGKTNLENSEFGTRQPAIFNHTQLREEIRKHDRCLVFFVGFS